MKEGLIAMLVILSLTAAQAMELGGNFWNLGWHKPGDCFRDFKNVSGDNPWNPQFLKEITIYRSLRFMDWDNTNGSAHFCHYAHVGQAGDGGAWGCIEHTGQPLAEAPKFRALVEWSQQR